MTLTQHYGPITLPVVGQLSCKVAYRMSWKAVLVKRLFALAALLLTSSIAILAIVEIASGPALIAGIAGAAMLNILLIYGIRINRLEVTTGGVSIDFDDPPGGKD